MTSTDRAMKWAGRTTGMSSCTTPSGNLNACSSQKLRRQSLFHAVRSATRGRNRVTCVRRRVRRNASAANGDCRVSCLESRWMLPVAKSEPVSWRAPCRSS